MALYLSRTAVCDLRSALLLHRKRLIKHQHCCYIEPSTAKAENIFRIGLAYMEIATFHHITVDLLFIYYLTLEKYFHIVRLALPLMCIAYII